MKTIYLDTEFTDLDSPKLISIALVKSLVTPTNLYVELTDGWEGSDLPRQLRGSRTGSEEQGEPVRVASDAPAWLRLDQAGR